MSSRSTQAVSVRQQHPGSDRVRKAIVVCGMHRSGTSALTRVLSLLGCDLPHQTIDPDGFNERGYWESPSVNVLNETILAAAGMEWSSWEMLEADWFGSSKAQQFVDDICDVITDGFGKSGLFVVKDPRISRLLPLWRTAFDRLGIAMNVVMAVRNPLESASSLFRRNGMNTTIGQLVWLRYVLDAEFHSRGLPRAFVDYDNLLVDWRIVVAMICHALDDIVLPRQTASAGLKVDTFLSPQLKHHDQALGLEGAVANYSPWIRQAWPIFQRWAVSNEQPDDQDALDDIRQNLDIAEQTFARPLLEHQAHSVYLADQVEQKEQLLSEAKAMLIERENLEAARMVETAGEDVSESTAELASLQTELDDMRADRERLRLSLEAFAAGETPIVTLLGSLHGSIIEQIEQADVRHGEIRAHIDETSCADRERLRLSLEAAAAGEKPTATLLESLHGSIIEQIGRADVRHGEILTHIDGTSSRVDHVIGQFREDVQARTAALENIWAVIASMQTANEHMAAELELARTVGAAKQQEIDRLVAEIEELDGELAGLKWAKGAQACHVSWLTNDMKRLEQKTGSEALWLRDARSVIQVQTAELDRAMTDITIMRRAMSRGS